jgi:hypothetical protein
VDGDNRENIQCGSMTRWYKVGRYVELKMLIEAVI